MKCSVCGKPLDRCQYPLSHSHPTIDHVKLPGRVNSMMYRLDRSGRTYPAGLTLQEREILQNTKIHDNDFSTELEPLYA